MSDHITLFTSEVVNDTNERIKHLVSGRVYIQTYKNIDFFIHKVDKVWNATEITTGRGFITTHNTKKESIIKAKEFIDASDNIKLELELNRVISLQSSDRILSDAEIRVEKIKYWK